MSHISLYLDRETESIVRKAAKHAHQSMSKWIAGVIRRAAQSDWPEDVRKAAGSWNDAPLAEELRSNHGEDIRREAL
jgi:hypothetical protein